MHDPAKCPICYDRRCKQLARRGLSDALVMQLRDASAPELLKELEKAADRQIQQLNRAQRGLDPKENR